MSPEQTPLLEFLHAVGRLKHLRRQGWVDRGVPDAESVADHTYRSAIMAWVLGSETGLNMERLLKLVLLHDLPEAEVGDATPYDQILARGVPLESALPAWRSIVSAEELARASEAKHRLESEALEGLVQSLEKPLASKLRDLWDDYSARRSPEAQFAAQIDKVEALLQAIEYRAEGHEADVESFLLSARDVVTHPVLRSLLKELETAANSSP